MQRLEDLLAYRREGLASVGSSCVLDRLQTEQHRGQLLAGLVVQLTGEATAFELLRLDDPSQRVACDTRRQVDGDRGASREGLGESKVVVA